MSHRNRTLVVGLLFLPRVSFGQPAMPATSAQEQLQAARKLADEAAEAYARKDFAKAAVLYERAYDAGHTVPSVAYNAACCYALLGRTDKAFEQLELAIVTSGWRDVEHLSADSDLKSLHADQRWGQMVRECQANRDEFRKSMSHADLHDELLKRMRADQDVRMAEKVDVSKMMAIDADNTAWMKQVVEKHGWPGRSMVGPDGAQAAWLLVQHADDAAAFQRRCLDLLAAAQEKGEATAVQVAYLTDRVLMHERRPQIYGTQFHTVDDKLQPFPIANEGEVDARRAAIGLEPISEYAKRMQAMERQ